MNNYRPLKSFPTFWMIILKIWFFYGIPFYMISLIVLLSSSSFKFLNVATVIAFILPLALMYFLWTGVLVNSSKVIIYRDKIVVKRLLKPKQVFDITELKHYRTSIYIGFRGSKHDYLYIMKDDEEITIISQFCHSNYRTMKDEIDMNLAMLEVKPEKKARRKGRKKDTEYEEIW